MAVNGLTGRFLINSRILISPGRGEATVRDLPSMKVAYSLRPHDDVDGPNVDISPDKKWILSWGPNRIVHLFDAASGKLAGTFSGSAGVSQVMMAPDSAGCYVVFDNSAFLLQHHHDYYIIKMSFPELTITGRRASSISFRAFLRFRRMGNASWLSRERQIRSVLFSSTRRT